MADPRPVPVVVGTAGHIDHGKSALIEALTGTHPDRWDEEQRRGITLDLGYAQTQLGGGVEVGFVDVPGHERLVRKMVAGATGMGAALLVVACDDGVMPQTREHFEVLQLLGVKYGVVALSKADLADEEMRELVRADVEALLEGSIWEGAPVLEVSAHAGTGIDELRKALKTVALEARRAPDPLHPFRVPVQRSFSIHGAGTVVTGVAATGEVKEGDSVVVLPAGHRSRVRRVQVHGRAAGASRAGLRTALSLPDVETEECPRGVVVGAPGCALVGDLLRAWVRLLPGAPKFQHGAPVHVLAGTAAVLARCFLPPEEERDASGMLVDLELGEPMALVPGERLILRRPSPGTNLAAGRALVFARRRLKRRDGAERESLTRLAAALDDPPECAARMLEQHEGAVSIQALADSLCWTRAATADSLEAASQAGLVRALGADRYVAMTSAGALERAVAGVIAKWQSEQPHRLRIPVLYLRGELGKERAATLERMEDEELVLLGLGRLPGREWKLVDVEPDPSLQPIASRALERLAEAGLKPPARADLATELGVGEQEVGQALELLADQGELVIAGEGRAFARGPVEELREALVAQFAAGGPDIPALRDRFGTSRKFLVPLLEYFDERGVTVRRGPNRLLRDAEASLV